MTNRSTQKSSLHHCEHGKVWFRDVVQFIYKVVHLFDWAALYLPCSC